MWTSIALERTGEKKIGGCVGGLKELFAGLGWASHWGEKEWGKKKKGANRENEREKG